MLDRLKGWLHRRTAPTTRAQQEAEAWTLRRWEGAETNRLNKAQAQKVTSARPGPIGLRLKTIAPRRLHTPVILSGDPDVIMGVRHTREGEPVEYFISDPRRFGAFMLETGAFTPVPANLVIHRFLV